MSPTRPAPPEAMTGTSTTEVTARSNGRSKPARVPSRSIEVSSSSPAPRSTAALRPLDDVEAGARPAAPDDDLPAGGTGRTLDGPRPRVDGDHDALASEAPRASPDQVRIGDRRRVEGHLVGPGPQHVPHLGRAAHPAAHGQGHEEAMRGATDRGEERAARLGRRVDVEEHELIRSLGRVPGGQLGRVALVEQVDEPGALHDPPAGHVEAGDDPPQQHHAAPGVESGAPTATAPDPRDAEPDEVGQEPQAVGAGSLGVELGAQQPAAGHDAREPAAVGRLGHHDLRGCGSPGERVHEVGRRAVGEVGDQRMGSSQRDLVPADVGEPRRVGDGLDAAGQEAQQSPCRPPRMPRTAAAARGRCPGTRRRPPPRRGSPRPGRGGAGGASPGRWPRPPARRARLRRRGAGPSPGRPRPAAPRRPAAPPRRCAGCLPHSRSPRCAAESARSCEATLGGGHAGAAGSGSAAARSATARALNAASATWWSLRPVARRWTVRPAARANDSRACGTSCVDNAPIRSPVKARSSMAYGRPERSRAHVARASSMGTAAWPKRRMPARSPRAAAMASPSTSATSSTVWCSSTSRSPVAWIVRSSSAWWASDVSRWS